MRGHWHRFDICQIEDLSNAVLGAELEVVQMSGPRVSGSLAFAASEGVTFSSGWIHGNVAISGPLSTDAITIGVGLRVGAGTRLWLNAVQNGDVGVFLPGSYQDGLYTHDTLYLAATLTLDRIAQEAARAGLRFDPTLVSRTGLHARPISPLIVAQLCTGMARIHAGDIVHHEVAADIGFVMLRSVIAHYAQFPQIGDTRVHPLGRATIVDKARDYLRTNLAAPVVTQALAAAAGTSERTLARAFVEVLQDTPANYIRRLRLHRIRRDLAAGKRGSTVSDVAARWGIGEPGRMSGWYRELFGELPNETRARMRQHNRLRRRLL